MNSITPDPREKQNFIFHETPFRKVLLGFVRFTFSVFIDLRVENQENLPKTGACVMVSNHLSNFDGFLLQFAMPRLLFFMGKAELFKNPVMGWGLRQLGAFPVNRGASDTWALGHARKILDKGLLLAMFPEGTRSKGRGLAVAKTGAARLAIEKNATIAPVSLIGTDRVGKNFPRRTVVTVRFSPAITPEPDDDPLSLTDRLMFTIAHHLPPEMRGVYSEVPAGFEDKLSL